MNWPRPFAYPAEPHESTHAPDGYANYQEYKPWLRDDFVFRCAYCLTRERWSPSGHATFGADHLVAQAEDSSLVVSYLNLVYACNACNSAKQAEASPIDPFQSCLADHLVIHEDGSAHALTLEGQDFIDFFDLAGPDQVGIRDEKLSCLRAKKNHPNDADIDKIYRKAFGYPDDLPDLRTKRPPQGNAKPDGLLRSYHTRRAQGTLPDVY